jgi:hypothetical protein
MNLNLSLFNSFGSNKIRLILDTFEIIIFKQIIALQIINWLYRVFFSFWMSLILNFSARLKQTW